LRWVFGAGGLESNLPTKNMNNDIVGIDAHAETSQAKE